MNIIFLDFDGPMIPMRAWVINVDEDFNNEKFDPVAVATIIRVLNQAKAKLVISSSWRTNGYKLVVETLERSGISKEYLHEDWMTKNLYNHSPTKRGLEIREWLERHPETNRFAVIDDIEINIENLIHVSEKDGISYQNQLDLFHVFNLSP